MSTATRVDLRCPTGPRRLFAILSLQGEPTPVVDGNLIELACADCRKTLARQGQHVTRVLHYYNLAGDWIKTEAVL